MIPEPNYPQTEAKMGAALMRRPDITLRENLDAQIVQAEKNLQQAYVPDKPIKGYYSPSDGVS